MCHSWLENSDSYLTKYHKTKSQLDRILVRIPRDETNKKQATSCLPQLLCLRSLRALPLLVDHWSRSSTLLPSASGNMESTALVPKRYSLSHPVIDYEAISPNNDENDTAPKVPTSTKQGEEYDSVHPQQRVMVAVAVILAVFLLLAAVRPSALTASDPVGLRARGTGGGGGLLTTNVVHQDDTTSYYEVLDDTYDIVHGVAVKRVLASGTYVRNAGGNGWNHLTVTAGEGYESSPTAYERSQIASNNYVRAMEAAGYLEGHATCVEMAQYYNNFCASLSCPSLVIVRLSISPLSRHSSTTAILFVIRLPSLISCPSFVVARLSTPPLSRHSTRPLTPTLDLPLPADFGLFDGGDPMPDTLKFMEANHRWMATEAEKYWDTSDYWLAVRGALTLV